MTNPARIAAPSRRSSDPSASMSPLEALGAELGAIAAQIDRETSLRLDAALADLKRSTAEWELRLERMERSIADRVAALEAREKPRVKVPAGSSAA